MKKIAIAALIAAGLVLTGCSVPHVTQESKPAPAAPAPQPAPAQPEAQEAPDVHEIALEVLREQAPVFQYADDALIDETALATCTLFDEGGTFELYIAVSLESGMDAGDAGALAGYAVALYCPQHSGIFE